MTDRNVETLRKVVKLASEARVSVAASDEDELAEVWDILLQATIALRTFARKEGVTL